MSLLNDQCPLTKQIDNIDETIKELNERLGEFCKTNKVFCFSERKLIKLGKSPKFKIFSFRKTSSETEHNELTSRKCRAQKPTARARGDEEIG
jgi:hypothetical protein